MMYPEFTYFEFKRRGAQKVQGADKQVEFFDFHFPQVRELLEAEDAAHSLTTAEQMQIRFGRLLSAWQDMRMQEFVLLFDDRRYYLQSRVREGDVNTQQTVEELSPLMRGDYPVPTKAKALPILARCGVVGYEILNEVLKVFKSEEEDPYAVFRRPTIHPVMRRTLEMIFPDSPQDPAGRRVPSWLKVSEVKGGASA